MFVEVALVALVVAAVVAFVAAPLRPSNAWELEASAEAERADLEAARNAKYAEIREAELDYRTGKLSEADWRRMDRTLRGEAVDILHRLDALE